MKYAISLLLLTFVLTSCQEQKNNKSKKVGVVFEENEMKPVSPKSLIDTLESQQLITNKIDSTLPTPAATFYFDIDTSTSLDFILDKYINSNFSVTKATKVLETTTADHPEGVWDCHTRTEYGNIAVEEYTCELFLTNTIEFNNYSFKEVNRMLKILFTEKSNNGESDGWHEGEYIYGDSMCSLSILANENQIIVTYGCSC